jgi:hypothetical protein
MIVAKKSLGVDGVVSVTRTGNTLVLKDESGTYSLIELVGGGTVDFNRLILGIDGSIAYINDGDPILKI